MGKTVLKSKIHVSDPWRVVLLVLAATAMIVLCFDEAEAVTEWHSFRGNENNNAVVAYPTPTETDSAGYVWKKKFDKSASGMTNWGKAPTPPIIVNGELIVLSGPEMNVMDKDTGKILRSADLVAGANWGGTPPTFAETEDGKRVVFLPLAQRVQAVDLDTMESLWTYKVPGSIDEEKGIIVKSQSVSPIAYSDDMVYTGFFASYTLSNDFVAITTKEMTAQRETVVRRTVDGTEQDVTVHPGEMLYPGEVVWKYNSPGGFYWNGAVVVGDHVIVGTQDGAANNDVTGASGGASMTSHVISFDKKTGDVVTDLELEGAGDICSTIVYDGADRIYWTSCGGMIHSAVLDPATGELTAHNQEMIQYPVTPDEKLVPLTVNTPIVYKDRVYLGYKTRKDYGVFAAYDRFNLENLFRAPLRGYPKGSPILSTAYEDTTGYLYAYVPYYEKPGGLQLVRFRADTEGDENVLVQDLLIPVGYEEYAFTSPVADEDGVLYHKNDSTTMFAVTKKDPVAVPQIKGLKVTASGRKVTAKWTKGANCDRYRVLYRLNDRGSWNFKLVTGNSFSFTAPNSSKVRLRVRGEYFDTMGTVTGAYSADRLTYAAKSSIKSIARKKKAFTVKYDKHANAGGYKIQYSLKKSFAKAKTVTVKGASNTKKTVRKLKAKKKYFVRVRSYKKINGVMRYGAWSKTGTVTTR